MYDRLLDTGDAMQTAAVKIVYLKHPMKIRASVLVAVKFQLYL
jgi:hypothetical protein